MWAAWAVSKSSPPAWGDAGRLHDRFGEPLRGLDLRGGPGWAEGGDVAVRQCVDEAGGEGRFGSDDDEVDPALGGGLADAANVGVVDLEVLTQFGSSGVARRRVDGLA